MSVSNSLLLVSLFITKIAYMICIYFYIDAKKDHDNYMAEKIRYVKICIHTLFLFLMGVLMIHLFKPKSSSKEVFVGKQESLYLCLFGVICIVESAQYAISYLL